MKQIVLPNDVIYILNTLETNGFEGYIVGGCLRDILLEVPPHDFDITTNATPQQVKQLFKEDLVINTGIKHGTVTVFLNNVGYEITTFRNEYSYSDHRHPDKVTFSNSIYDDLKRRDFTINSIAYNPNKGIIDPFNGQQDLQNKIVKCVGNPLERFDEDALRILRCIRFASRLGFEIDSVTKQALFKQKELLSYVSSERIVKEFNEIICNDNIGNILKEFGEIFAIFIPEINLMINYDQHSIYHKYDLWEHTYRVVQATPPDKNLRWAALFHDIGKPKTMTIGNDGYSHYYGHEEVSSQIAKEILTRLHVDSHSIEEVTSLVYYHGHDLSNKTSLKKVLGALGPELFSKLIALQKADNIARVEKYIKPDSYYENIQVMTKEVIEAHDVLTIKDLAVDGNDLINIGLQGKEIGQTLQQIYDLVIDEKLKNDFDSIIEYVKSRH